MVTLDNATQQELLALLAPPFRREDEREGLLALALGMDCPLLGRIDWGGAAEPFVLRLVAALARYGEIEPGKQALWKVLEAVRLEVGVDRQARIDALAPIVNRPATPGTGATATGLESAPPAPIHLRVFLASPGDVCQERALALGVLEQLPYDPLLRGQVTIEAVAWDKPGAGTPMLATLTPQAAIAAGLPTPSQCDILVVILWSRMGTPLPADYRKPDGTGYASGTEWEYLDALESAKRSGRPDILVYRRTEKCLLDPDDPQFEDKLRQRRAVEAFFAGFRNPDGSIRGGYNAYETPESFGRQLDLHLRELIRRVLQGRPGEAPVVAAPARAREPPLWRGSPFPGLRAFTPDDAPIFFGRGREADALVSRLADGCRFLAVVGGSGSGKSSLVAAGLLPRLKDNAIEGAKDWLLPRVATIAPGERKQWLGLRFTPGELGDDPLVALAARLAPLLPEETTPGQVARRLADEPGAMARYAERILAGSPPWAEALVLIDQFEELLTVVAEDRRQAFIDWLATAAGLPRLRILVTMRVDFYHRWLAWPGLPEVLRGAPAPVVAPGLAALFQTITGPAARAGLDLEEGLAARILEDTGTDSGALALLAFALHALYEGRTPEGRLTHRAYDAFGGVRGAISRRAEDTFGRLPAAAQASLGAVFRELVEADERGVATRRRVSRECLATSPLAAGLIDAFTDARLLVSDRGPGGEAILEVAHEALFREWPRLRDWIGERVEDLRELRQAEAAAGQWRAAGGPPSHLWTHERLAPVYEALTRLGTAPGDLAEPMRSFLRPEAQRLIEELERPRLSHYRRAEIGDRLARIGDPRPGVGLGPDGLPDISWCPIPGGEVALEEDGGRFRVEPFHIARYPVTYRQYRAFLEAPDGYRDKRWWKGLRQENGPGEQYRPTDNHPAEGVSWHDALAFCRWLSAGLGQEVRLPTEWEWQQAATGGDADTDYPWGDWDEGRANTDESHLSRTTAVGMYPDGASAQGALDLAGNVWEWCLNPYDNPRELSEGGNARRVVRGGSWDNDRGLARCAYRFHGVPDYRLYILGFRLVCVAPIPGTADRRDTDH